MRHRSTLRNPDPGGQSPPLRGWGGNQRGSLEEAPPGSGCEGQQDLGPAPNQLRGLGIPPAPQGEQPEPLGHGASSRGPSTEAFRATASTCLCRIRVCSQHHTRGPRLHAGPGGHHAPQQGRSLRTWRRETCFILVLPTLPWAGSPRFMGWTTSGRQADLRGDG